MINKSMLNKELFAKKLEEIANGDFVRPNI